MASKKRSRGNKGPSRSGRMLSGNPQKRAQQLTDREAVTGTAASHPPALPGLADLLERVRAEDTAWWDASHASILERARDLKPPDGPRALESMVCQIVGDEYWKCFTTEKIGFHHGQWIGALARLAAAEVKEHHETDRWIGPWLLLQGITTIAHSLYADEPSPNLTELAGDLSTSARQAIGPGRQWLFEPITRRVTGQPMVLRDAYGCRVAVLVPVDFVDPSIALGSMDPHWYCWDVDQCSTSYVASAGVFDSAETAVGEWRRAVGPSADIGDPRPSSPAAAVRLLSDYTDPNPFGMFFTGFEPREFMAEVFRMRHRAVELSRHFDVETPPRGHDQAKMDRLVGEFQSWHAERHGEKPDSDDVYTLLDHWGPPGRFERPGIFGCSPHRIEMTAVLLHDMYDKKYVPGIMGLMPAWVDWCLEHNGLEGELAERAMTAARDAAHLKEPPRGDDVWERGGFRRIE